MTPYRSEGMNDVGHNMATRQGNVFSYQILHTQNKLHTCESKVRAEKLYYFLLRSIMHHSLGQQVATFVVPVA